MNEILKAPSRRSWLLLFGVLLGLLVAIAGVCANRLLGNDVTIENSASRLRHLQAVERATMQIESGVRGYLIAQDPAYLSAYERGAALLDPALVALSADSADAPEKELEAAKLAALASDRRRIADITLQLARTNSPRLVLSTNGGLKASEALHRQIDTMREREEGRLQTLRGQNRQSVLTSVTLLGVTIILLTIGAITAWRASRDALTYAAALRDSRSRFRRLLEIGASSFLEVQDGIVVDASDNVEQLFGRPPNEIVGMRLEQLFVGPASEIVTTRLPELSNAVGGSMFERQRMTGPDGEQRVVDIRVVSYLKSGQILLMLAIRDVTDQVRLEEQLAHSRRLEAIGALTGGVAHDFNNLLTIVLGNAETLEEILEGEGQAASRELASLVRQSAERGSKLTQQLLAFARRQPLVLRSVDVGDRLDRLKPMLHALVGASSLRILVEPDTNRVHVDAAQFDNAIMNLAINAVAAMPDGGQIIIEAENVILDESYAAWNHEVKPGHYVRLSVSDTGHGMDPATISRAFEPFFTTKPAGQGSGMGLSMVYGLLKQIGGHAKIYSEVGEGTTINLYFAVAPEDAIAHTLDSARRPVPLSGDETILLVEDDEMVLAHVSRQLEELGYRTILAKSAEEALALLDEHDVDLLFTDVVMPGGMNGRKLAEEVARRRPSLPVLFTSGYTENAIVHSGRLDEGVQLLAKPYGRSELGQAIRKALSRGSEAIQKP